MAVTFNTDGYNTPTPPFDLAWARYSVRSPADWEVKAVAASNAVTIEPGRGSAHGVTDMTYERETLQLDPATTGTRWDLITIRRDWNADVSKFMKINGGADPKIPMARLVTPGNYDDQPLALVPVTSAGVDQNRIIDLRVWVGDGGCFIANHDLVKDYLNTTGTRIVVNGADWVRVPGTTGPEWRLLGREVSRSGVALVRTNANGDGTVLITDPFPTKLVAAHLTDITAPAQLGAIILKGTAGTSSKSRITFRAYQSNGAVLPGQDIAVWYTAFGN